MIRYPTGPSSRFLAVGVAATTLAVLGACAKIDTPPPLPKPLHIDLTAPVTEQIDLAWPTVAEEPVEEHVIGQPRRVTLRLPDGQQIAMDAERVTFKQHEGMLTGVNIQPDAAVDHPDAVARTRQLLEDNRLLSARLARTFDGWAVSPVETRHSARITIRDVDVQVALTPDSRTGWQATLDFEPRACGMSAGVEEPSGICLHPAPVSPVVAGG